MEISVQAMHEETIRPEIGRLHAEARAEAHSKEDVVRKVTEAVGQLQAEFHRLQEAGAVVDVVVRPLTTSSWRPSTRGRLQPAQFTAQAGLRADFTDFTALADLAARFGASEGLNLQWVEWRLTDETRRELESACLIRAVEKARDRALVMARAAGEQQVRFVQVADPGLLTEPASARDMAFGAPVAMMRSAKAGAVEELTGIEIQPEDITVTGQVQARFVAG